MKRLREEDEEEEKEGQKMAGIRLLLSSTAGKIDKTHKNTKPTDCPFECKTCSRRFASLQALGGHRTSHKRTRVRGVRFDQTKSLKLEPKVHQCAVCGLKFPMGQALGGHMRRHKLTTQRLSQNHRENKSGVVKVLLPDLNVPPRGTELEVRPPECTLGFLDKAPTLDCLNLLN